MVFFEDRMNFRSRWKAVVLSVVLLLGFGHFVILAILWGSGNFNTPSWLSYKMGTATSTGPNSKDWHGNNIEITRDRYVFPRVMRLYASYSLLRPLPEPYFSGSRIKSYSGDINGKPFALRAQSMSVATGESLEIFPEKLLLIQIDDRVFEISLGEVTMQTHAFLGHFDGKMIHFVDATSRHRKEPLRLYLIDWPSLEGQVSLIDSEDVVAWHSAIDLIRHPDNRDVALSNLCAYPVFSGYVEDLLGRRCD